MNLLLRFLISSSCPSESGDTDNEEESSRCLCVILWGFAPSPTQNPSLAADIRCGYNSFQLSKRAMFSQSIQSVFWLHCCIIRLLILLLIQPRICLLCCEQCVSNHPSLILCNKMATIIPLPSPNSTNSIHYNPFVTFNFVLIYNLHRCKLSKTAFKGTTETHNCKKLNEKWLLNISTELVLYIQWQWALSASFSLFT